MTINVEQTYQERILKVLIYIQNNLDSELSLEELAGIAFFSPFHFHRIFTTHTGESIKSYVRRLRLERATRDLSYTDLSLMKISERAGYDTQQSFHRAFKETYHETPKNFRTHASDDIHKVSQSMLEIPSVRIKNIEPFRVAFVRHIGPYSEIMQAWHQLSVQIGLPCILSKDTLKISIAYDTTEATPENKLRYDACITLNALPDFKPKGQIGAQTIHGGNYAVVTHHGALETIESTYIALFGLWLPQSGHEPSDHPNFLLHRTNPIETATDQLITDIYLPIK
ncbi:MAG: AraC family transcriptional regulator [Coxiellaceae bacterium]|nr:AraC family transcriptional regulator [Coxiellaceae bacterium]